MLPLFLGLIFYSIFSWPSSASEQLCDKMACRSYAGLVACKERKGYTSWPHLFKHHKECKQSFAYVCAHNVPRSKGEPYAGCRNGPESIKACAYATNYSPKQLLRNSKTCRQYYERYLKIQEDKAQIEEEIDELFDEIRTDDPKAIASAQAEIDTAVKEDSYLPRPSLKMTHKTKQNIATPVPLRATPQAPPPYAIPPAPLPTYPPGYSTYPSVPYAYPAPYVYPAPYPYPRQRAKQRPRQHQAQPNPLFEKIGMDTIKTIGSAILAA